MAWGKQQSFFGAAAHFSCISSEVPSCRNRGLPEGASACQEGGSWWRLGRGYPKQVPRCQGKAAWENVALSQFSEEEKPERERKRKVWPSAPKRGAGEVDGRGHYGTTCGHCSALGQPGMSWGMFLSSNIGGSGCHGAKGYMAVLILLFMISLFQPLCEFCYSFFISLRCCIFFCCCCCFAINAVRNFSSFFMSLGYSVVVTVALCEEDGSPVELINATKGLLLSTTFYSVTTGLCVVLPSSWPLLIWESALVSHVVAVLGCQPGIKFIFLNDGMQY